MRPSYIPLSPFRVFCPAVDDGGGHISIKPKNDPDKVKITEWGNLKGKEGVPNPLAEQVQQARTDSVKICH